jgi:hypothetical protein
MAIRTLGVKKPSVTEKTWIYPSFHPYYSCHPLSFLRFQARKYFFEGKNRVKDEKK